VNGGPLPYEVNIYGPSGSKMKWTAPNAGVVTDWVHFSIPISPENWTIVNGTWSQILSGVSSVNIRIRVFSNISVEQSNDIDNAYLRRRQDVLPFTYAVTEGEEGFGGLSSLFASDDDRLGVFNDSLSLGTTVTFSGLSPFAPVNQLRFLLESHTERGGMVQTLRLKNRNTLAWVPVDGRVATSEDSSVMVELNSNANAYVGSSGEMEAQVSVTPVNDESPSQDGWLTAIDVAKWQVM